jgi:hypothetical protein
VIVGDDDSGGVGQDGRLEYLARMHEAAVEGAATEFMNAEDVLLRAEQKHEADFNGFEFAPLAQ